ncbi:sodium/glutamate symporter [Roseococcus thiosulfatophilus]|uniref:sodium/glutamate symporter n=1 Tax=Roseococcus thiosulfatophilus TaxID=35813 RepID=UPI001A8FB4C6|nr:sodium/glutamate symporter [Roseococcus thiosulfatophilus]
MALDAVGSLAVAALVILLGRALHRGFPALTRWHIPEPVSGGTAWALGVALLHLAGAPVPETSAAIREPMLLAFFATVGLSADLRQLLKGGALLARFALLTVLFILVQNALGVGLALALGLDPLIGLLAGSVTLVGGHGTGAAFGGLFAREYGVPAALELAVAASTLGIVIGGLLAGPVARGLGGGAGGGGADSPPPPPRRPDEAALAPTLALVLLCVAAAMALVPMARSWPVTLPDFLWALLAGVLLRNLVLAPLRQPPPPPALEALSGVTLALFLALAMAALRLWELVALAGPLLLLLAAQTLATALFARWLVFRVMGDDAEAAVCAAGFFGFAIGSTATAVATMREMENHHGPMPRAILIVSLTAGLFVTLANALLLSLILMLPLFAR